MFLPNALLAATAAGADTPINLYPPRILAGVALFIAACLIMRLVSVSRTRTGGEVGLPAGEAEAPVVPRRTHEGPYILMAIVAALLGIIWSFLRSEQPDKFVLLGILGVALLLPAIWKAVLPWDYDSAPARPRHRSPDSLANDLTNAITLLAFLKSQGRVGKPDGPNRIGETDFDAMRTNFKAVRAKLDSNPPQDLTDSEENTFYRSVSQLTITAYPVTVESLAEAAPENGERSQGAREVDFFGRLMLFAIILLVVFQAYTAVGLTLYSGHLNAEQRVRQAFDLPVPAAAKEAAAKRTPVPNEKRLSMDELESANGMLGAWVKPAAGACAALGMQYDTKSDEKVEQQQPLAAPAPAKPAPDAGDLKVPSAFDKYRIQSRLTLDFLNTYLLPLLYGLAGAMVYVVRRLTGEVSGLSYRSGVINYPVRIWLGCVAGLAIGWFQHSTGAGGTEIAPAPQLAPLALAFLAGFGVEIFFALLDRGLRAFTDQPGTKPGQ